MYEQTFNFSQRPFNVCPQAEDYFPGQSHQQAITSSRSCVDRRNGPATIIGAVGTGKSLAMQVIGEVYADQFDVVSIECSRMEQRSELLQSILFGMNLPFREMSEGELRLSLIDHLKNGNGNSNGILLLVDEADRLSIELLDELRLITNIVRQGRSQAQLVLAGSQRLEESLNDPRLASFNQRIASRSYLQNFSRDEVGDYIADHIGRVGGESDNVFEKEAVEQIARNSDGCPRVINQLCERALTRAAKEQSTMVTQEIVQHAWAELQNLPIPKSADAAAKVGSDLSEGGSGESVIEFGSLDDDDQGSSAFTSQHGGQADDAFSNQADADCKSFETTTDSNASEDESELDSLQSDDQLSESQGSDPESFDGPDAVDDKPSSDYGGEVGSEFGNAETEAEASESAILNPSSWDSQTGDESSSDDSTDSWGGRLPTNLGVADYRSYDAGSAGYAVPPYGSGVDPFAPQEDALPKQQFQYGSQSAVDAPAEETNSQAGDSQNLQDDSSKFSDSISTEEYSHDRYNEPTPKQTNGYSTDPTDERIQALEQEQQDLLEKVDAATSPFDTQTPFGAMSGDLLNQHTSQPDVPNEVQAAFDGLEQIDQARSAENYSPPAPMAPLADADQDLQPVDAVADPFDEDFEEEILLQDAYTPFVAKQNQSSLSVTSEQLSHLHPSDDDEAKEDVNQSVTSDNDSVALDALSKFQVPPKADATYVPVQSVSTELSDPDAFQSLPPKEQIADENAEEIGEEIGEEIDPDLAALTSDFSFDEEMPAVVQPNELLDPSIPGEGAAVEGEIREQTLDIVRDLQNVVDTDHSQETGNPFSQPPSERSQENAAFGADVRPLGVAEQVPESLQYPQQPPLDESQQVLREILAQQQIIQGGNNANNDQGAYVDPAQAGH